VAMDDVSVSGMDEYRTDCRHFTGYRPCAPGGPCSGCEDFALAIPDILLINLDAMGDVLRTTALIPAIRRAHPEARITWLTRPRAAPLLRENPGIDRVLTLGVEADILLRTLHFDLVLNADKSMVAGALAVSVNAKERRGFGVDPAGTIIPLNPEAHHLYAMGLDDTLKFHTNQRTAPDLLAEALGFKHQRDEYVLKLPGTNTDKSVSVGFNTGCGPAWPLKKLNRELAAAAIRTIAEETGEPVLLLGGPEDQADHQALQLMLGELVEMSSLNGGVAEGAAQVDRCAVVVSGDSLGMHMAIALRKHVVAWFGPTSPQEIDLYGRGVKLLADVDCAPCWRPQCEKAVPCNTRVPSKLIAEAVVDCLSARAAGERITAVRGGEWGG
jgi:heptosyltransferase II